jgi:tRNA pseudouridine55 synthase
LFGIDKPLGLSSLQALDRLRASDSLLRDKKLGHAGRLDPMAEGLMTVLVGEETQRVHEVRGQDKTYELTVVLGVATDSFDSLGLVTHLATDCVVHPQQWAAACGQWTGEVSQKYPPFSQGRVEGRSLLSWGAEGLHVDRPAMIRTIRSIEILEVGTLEGGFLVAEAVRRTSLVVGPLRQEAVAAHWKLQSVALGRTRFPSFTLRVACSAGTYMRSLAYDLGNVLAMPAFAWKIRRTRAGDLRIEDARLIV